MVIVFGEYFVSRFLVLYLLEQLLNVIAVGVHNELDFLEIQVLFLLLYFLGLVSYALEPLVRLQHVLFFLLEQSFVLGHVVGVKLLLQQFGSGLWDFQLNEPVHFILMVLL